MAELLRVRASWIYLVLAMIFASVPILLFYREPIIYAHLVTEDFAGEYATSIGFAVAGLLFLVDALHAPARGRRAVGFILGVIALVIAGEEVSWGERGLRHLFGIDVPDSIRAINQQGEMNLHNLEGVGLRKAYRPGSYLLLGWLTLSAVLFATRPALAGRLSAAGMPLVPLRLSPLCVLPPLFFLLSPVAKSDEVGELLLGVAALSFALDRTWSSGWGASARPLMQPTALVVSLVAVGLLAFGLAAFSPLRHMAWRLHVLAERDYPRYGRFDSAEKSFDFIYSHARRSARCCRQAARSPSDACAGRGKAEWPRGCGQR
jgi:hypothetical protein